jgi:2-haloacid dehalogenase
MLELPTHHEVPDALSWLRSAGFPVATLTNSSPEMVRAQLGYAGILELFDYVLSVDEVGRYKPAPEPYHLAAGQPPDVVGADLSAVADAIVNIHEPRR